MYYIAIHKQSLIPQPVNITSLFLQNVTIGSQLNSIFQPLYIFYGMQTASWPWAHSLPAHFIVVLLVQDTAVTLVG